MVSRADLTALYPRAPQADIDAFAAQGDALLARFGIAAAADRLHFFLAQIGHESGGLTSRMENLNYSAQGLCDTWPGRFPDLASAQPLARNPEAIANRVYSGRMGNGPEASGDGWRYRGRGYIQVTGKDAYQTIGGLIGEDLVAAPDRAADPQHALNAACGFWQWKGLNALCDQGDFAAVTRRINGGLTGLADRRAWLDKVRRLYAQPPAVAAQPSPADVIAIQRALRAQGYTELGAADGLIGPRTMAAITRFRQAKGLPAGGGDVELAEALGIAG